MVRQPAACVFIQISQIQRAQQRQPTAFTSKKGSEYIELFFAEKASLVWCKTYGVEKMAFPLTDLPEEMLIAILAAMGNHPAGLTMRCIARRVCCTFRQCPLVLPCAAATTTLNLPLLLVYVRQRGVELVRAYDFGSARIVSMCVDPAVYMKWPNGPNDKMPPPSLRPHLRSLRYSCVEDRFAWLCADRWDTCTGADLRDGMSFALNANVRRELLRSTVCGLRPITPSDAHGRRPSRTRLQPACAVDANHFFRAVCDALPTNPTRALNLEGLGLTASSVTLPAFDASKLTHLSIKNTRLCSNAVCYLAGLTHLSFLDLSHSVVFTLAPLAALAELVRIWHGTSVGVSRLNLDGDRDAAVGKGISSRLFAPLVNAMEDPDHLERTSPCCLIDRRVYISCNIIHPMEWDNLIGTKTPYLPAAAPPLAAAAALPLTAATAVAPPLAAAPLAPPLAAAAAAAAPLAPPLAAAATVAVFVPAVVGRVHTHYTDAKRELDRGMFGWFDYACRNCGTVWTKNSVTVSFRQTAVSECLKSKRSCASRDECSRMLAGEKFITDKHCLGNGGKDLSPRPTDVLRYEQEGLLVGVNPSTGRYELFQPHPTKVEFKVAV